MMLFLATAALVASLAIGVVILFANGMSDNPSARASYRPMWAALAVTAVLFASWYYGW